MDARFVAAHAQPADAYLLVSDVREVDEEEWWAGTGEPVLGRLLETIRWGRIARTVFFRDGFSPAPLMMWGADRAQDRDGWGQVWLIGTNLGMQHVRSLHAMVKVELPLLDAVFPRSVAYADERNVVHHRWLQWMGYRETGEAPMGPYDHIFKIFERTR